MILFKKAKDLNNWITLRRKNGATIGFIPTMGALHEGHISLISTSKKTDSVTICSIFVNPAQFNNQQDFDKYPISIEKDIELLEQSGCDVLFIPSFLEIYPNGINQSKNYEIGDLENILEGKYRPGHFQGVCMVVHRLLEIIPADHLYLGQKDYQQCKIIATLIDLVSLNTKPSIIICPTLREKDGLAMSSRNRRLNEKERDAAPTLFNTLNWIKNNISKGSLITLNNKAQNMLMAAGFKTDYIVIAYANTLSSINDWDGDHKIVALVAATLNEVRLIDNLPLN